MLGLGYDLRIHPGLKAWWHGHKETMREKPAESGNAPTRHDRPLRFELIIASNGAYCCVQYNI